MSEVLILWSGKFCDLEESITLPIPMLERMLEDEAELWRYLELAEGGAGAGGSGMVTPPPSKLDRLPYTPTLLSRPPMVPV